MKVITDTKRLKARLNDVQARMLFDCVIKPYKQEVSADYYCSVQDKRRGIFLGHLHRAPYMNFTTALSFHSYSDDSPLLSDIFKVVPLRQWYASEIHVAFDYDHPYEQFHAVRPAKRADPEWRPNSLYLGGASSHTRLYMYNKQLQMREKHHVQTDTWTRIELRYRFTPMKRISRLGPEDFAAAARYSLLTDIATIPDNLKDIVLRLNQNTLDWQDVHWKMKKKIREYAASTQGDNLYQHILSNIGDMESFIYAPTVLENRAIDLL